MKIDRNGRQHRLVPVTDPAEQSAVLGEATLQSPIGGADGSGAWAERGSLEAWRKWMGREGE